MDANGDTIGQVVGFFAGGSIVPTVSVFVLFEMSGQMFLAEVVSVSSGPSGFKVNTVVYFSELDCQGASWVEPQTEVRLSFFGEFRAAIIATDTFDEPRLFHVVPGTAIIGGVGTKSLTSGSQCINSNHTYDLFSATELDPDLHVTFPKPYSLDLK